VAEASETLTVDVDKASLKDSLQGVRGLMFEVNSVRNLISDTQKMATDPSLTQAFWLGMQVQMTTRRAAMLPETVAALQEQAALAAAALGPYAAPAAILAAAALTLAALVSRQMEIDKQMAAWEKKQAEMAKSQGITPFLPSSSLSPVAPVALGSTPIPPSATITSTAPVGHRIEDDIQVTAWERRQSDVAKSQGMIP
jgi:hypothetical protein